MTLYFAWKLAERVRWEICLALTLFYFCSSPGLRVTPKHLAGGAFFEGKKVTSIASDQFRSSCQEPFTDYCASGNSDASRDLSLIYNLKSGKKINKESNLPCSYSSDKPVCDELNFDSKTGKHPFKSLELGWNKIERDQAGKEIDKDSLASLSPCSDFYPVVKEKKQDKPKIETFVMTDPQPAPPKVPLIKACRYGVYKKEEEFQDLSKPDLEIPKPFDFDGHQICYSSEVTCVTSAEMKAQKVPTLCLVDQKTKACPKALECVLQGEKASPSYNASYHLNIDPKAYEIKVNTLETLFGKDSTGNPPLITVTDIGYKSTTEDQKNKATNGSN